IARGYRAVIAAVALARPDIEGVVARGVAVVVGQAGAVEAVALSRVERVGRALAVGLAAAAAHQNRRRVVIGIDADAVLADARHGKREVRRIHFEGLAAPQAAHAHVDRTFG